MPEYEMLVIDGIDLGIFGRAWLFRLGTDPRQAFSTVKNVVGGSAHDHGFATTFPIVDASGDQVLVMLFGKDLSGSEIANRIEKVVVDMSGGEPIEDEPESQQAFFRRAADQYMTFLAERKPQQRFFG